MVFLFMIAKLFMIEFQCPTPFTNARFLPPMSPISLPPTLLPAFRADIFHFFLSPLLHPLFPLSSPFSPFYILWFAVLLLKGYHA